MSRKLSVDDLVRLAMIYAEQDRRSYADANRGCDDGIAAEADELADAFQAYRRRRWGKTVHEVSMESAPTISITELLRNLPPGDPPRD